MKNPTLKIPKITKDWATKPQKPNTAIGDFIVLFLFVFVLCPAFLWAMHFMELAQ